MKNTILTLLICFLSINVFAQNEVTDELKQLFDQQKFDLIKSTHAPKANDYEAEAVFLIGMTYFMTSEDANSLKMMTIAIEKDPEFAKAHHMKGVTYNYMNQPDKAIALITKAIELDDSDGEFYSSLGDAYFTSKQFKKALKAYETGTTTENPTDRSFIMIPQVYAELNQEEKALEAFYKAKNRVEKNTNSYITILYNIGLSEYLNQNFEKSEIAYLELLEKAPNDYQTYSKLIQVYYGSKEYEKANSFREKLYKAQKDGLLKGNLNSMFCFDQFIWKDKKIRVFERYEDTKGKLYYKHIFYVLNAEGGINCTIQTENSPIAIELGEARYILGMDKDNVHSTMGYGFEEVFKYDDLKSLVIKVLEERIKPRASSTVKKGK